MDEDRIAQNSSHAPMDHLLERIQTLEQHVQTLAQQTTFVARRLRWWRRLACVLVVLTVFGLPLSLGADSEDKLRSLAQRVRTLERKLQHVTMEVGVDNLLPELVITGANLRIVNGLKSTGCTDEQTNPIPGCPNGLGNLIVGYNEPRRFEEDIRTGSHNVVVGQGHNFSRFGGLVVGASNTISGDFASVSGGASNMASGFQSSVSGGVVNTASAFAASVSGGAFNGAHGSWSSVSGGELNTASGDVASVSGGASNMASGLQSSVSGGFGNGTPGVAASVSGGEGHGAFGFAASVSGGFGNTASGGWSSVSGGHNRTAQGEFDWRAGGLFQQQ